jgi:hypothetical protein
MEWWQGICVAVALVFAIPAIIIEGINLRTLYKAQKILDARVAANRARGWRPPQ